ncbi:unnamed protein product [Ixodes pacificus]
MISSPRIVPWCFGRETLAVVYVVRMLYYGARLVRSLGRRASEATMAPGSLSQTTLTRESRSTKTNGQVQTLQKMVREGTFITACNPATGHTQQLLRRPEEGLELERSATAPTRELSRCQGR